MRRHRREGSAAQLVAHAVAVGVGWIVAVPEETARAHGQEHVALEEHVALDAQVEL